MGCGSSGQVVAPAENGHQAHSGKEKMEKMLSGNEANGANGANGHHHSDDLPTVVLPDTPNKAKPPIAFEIPLEEFDGTRKSNSSPPPHLQRLLQPPPADLKLPDIEEKLAEAEQRRLMILQQRAASAQKRAQRVTKPISEAPTITDVHDINEDLLGAEESKHGPNVLTISPEPGDCEDKCI